LLVEIEEDLAKGSWASLVPKLRPSSKTGIQCAFFRNDSIERLLNGHPQIRDSLGRRRCEVQLGTNVQHWGGRVALDPTAKHSTLRHLRKLGVMDSRGPGGPRWISRPDLLRAVFAVRIQTTEEQVKLGWAPRPPVRLLDNFPGRHHHADLGETSAEHLAKGGSGRHQSLNFSEVIPARRPADPGSRPDVPSRAGRCRSEVTSRNSKNAQARGQCAVILAPEQFRQEIHRPGTDSTAWTNCAWPKFSWGLALKGSSGTRLTGNRQDWGRFSN